MLDYGTQLDQFIDAAAQASKITLLFWARLLGIVFLCLESKGNVVGQMCLKFWVPKACSERNPYLEEINRKLETKFLHESPQLHIKSETETQSIGASSKMKW